MCNVFLEALCEEYRRCEQVWTSVGDTPLGFQVVQQAQPSAAPKFSVNLPQPHTPHAETLLYPLSSSCPTPLA